MASFRRGQTEIMGLMVIVMILIFGGMIYISLINNPGSDAKTSLRTNVIAENALKSIMRVRMENYGDKSVEELVVDCHSNSLVCNQLEYAVSDAFGIVLRPGTNFTFAATYIDDDNTFVAWGLCDIPIVSRYIFVKDGNSYEIKLELC